MELNYDWRSFQSVFFSRKKLSPADDQPPIYLIKDRNVVISAFCEGQSLAAWIGATIEEVEAEFSHREFVIFERSQVDQWLEQSINMDHFYDQIQYLCAQARPYSLRRNKNQAKDLSVQRHFLLHAIQGWWSRFFPASYGIYINLDRNPMTSLLVIVQRQRIRSFQVPDLSMMIPERKRVPADVVKYIAERYLVPVQGLFLTSQEWAEWSEAQNPWQQVLSAIRLDRTKLAPFRWGLLALVMLRAYFGI
jgi:hypothetical protein